MTLIRSKLNIVQQLNSKLISHKHKFIFIHIPKCAGVSIYDVFQTKRDDQHHKRLCDLCTKTKLKTKNYFKFCFVRNPWDRFLSAYLYLKKGGRGGTGDLKGSKIIGQFNNFSDFIAKFNTVKDKFCDKHFYNQLYWMDNNIDYVGRYESFQHDFSIICDKIGIDRQQLPHKNATKHKHYTEYYDDVTKQIVAEQYAKDIEYFGYEFGT